MQVCPKDFLPSLLKWIEPENLPRYLGGTSDATLIDDAGPWNDPQIRAEIEEDMAHRDGSGSVSMSAHQESPQATASARSTPQGSGQLINGGGNFGQGPEAAALARAPEGAPLARGSEAAPFARGGQPVTVSTTAQRTSPFAAHSQHAPFDADSLQVGCSNTRWKLLVQVGLRVCLQAGCMVSELKACCHDRCHHS